MNLLKELKSISANISVLYVEDEDTLRQSVAQYLRLIFDKVDVAKDGKEGLAAFNKNSYDIVITDIQMPSMNGLEMIKAIREKDAQQNILIVTAYSEANYFMESISLDVDGYILKPIDFDKINKNLYKIVQQINIFRENQNYKTNLEKIVEERTTQNFILQGEKIKNYENTLLSLVEMVEKRDTYTGGHSLRVAQYCKLIADKMGYNEKDCELLYKAGILHDIGKIGTPDAVLLKPGKLNDLEYNIMKEHVYDSAQLLGKIPMYKELSTIVAAHHERYDGSGYPLGLKQSEIPELAKIMIVADAFDAMTTNRVYKHKMSVAEAMDELKAFSGTQFDPYVIAFAIDVLQDVVIDTNIFQLPSTGMEHKRFAYFYEDQVTEVYNEKYLDLYLVQNQNKDKLNKITVLFTHHFEEYNKFFGWDKGNLFLKDIANMLVKNYTDSMVFRINGDDFVILSNKHASIDSSILEPFLEQSNDLIGFTQKEFNALDDNINSLIDLKMYL